VPWAKQRSSDLLGTCDKDIALLAATRLGAEARELFLNLEKNESMTKPKLGFITLKGLTLPNGAKAENLRVDTGDHDKDAEVAKQLLGIDSVTSKFEKSKTSDDSVKLDDVAKRYRAEKFQEGSWRTKTAPEHEALHGVLVQILGK